MKVLVVANDVHRAIKQKAVREAKDMKALTDELLRPLLGLRKRGKP